MEFEDILRKLATAQKLDKLGGSEQEVHNILTSVKREIDRQIVENKKEE